MTTPFRVANDWQQFEEHILQEAGPVQRREMRRAFYAGAHALLCTVQALGSDAFCEAEGVSILSRLRTEIDTFYSDLVAGKV